MRLKAPNGIGHPTLAGMTIAPRPDGCYHIDDPDAARLLMDSFGYIDADAPPAKTERAPNPESGGLRKAIISALKDINIVVDANAPDKVLIEAIGAIGKHVNTRVAKESKAAEDRALASLTEDKVEVVAAKPPKA